ncbi:tRNA (guanosine(46)-N7)-methyltransferase TrmB [Candidatus Saccharibacteria bacterium 32-49-12]|nr:MAG: tRNA (guanosine(46)-N7)-methyltransferase TrmB [Candidatus Saccharibacteria bacterium 32-49-12]
MSQLNPDDFIITRKRKKYRFALFANSSLCYEFDEWDKSWPADVIEVGAGTGQFLVELASRHSDRRYVAIDVKGDRLQKGAREAEARGIKNVLFVRARADQLAELFQANSLSQIWLTFSDPFPKKRSSGRRLTHPGFLDTYRSLLRAGGRLSIKHDNLDFFHWTLEQLVAEGWQIDELSFDLHESQVDEDYKVLTPYEYRWLGEGSKINFVDCRAPQSS